MWPLTSQPESAKVVLGTVLIGAAIDTARADGAVELDFLRGSEAYKYGWGATDRVLLWLDLPAVPAQDDWRVMPGGRDGVFSAGRGASPSAR